MEPRITDEIYMKPKLPKIFVSSEMRTGSLNAERIAAAIAIESTGLATAWYWERDAVAGPYSSEAICLGQAGTSDGLILLIADRVSKIIVDEYYAAHKAGAPCFMFLKTGVERSSEANELVRRVRADGHTSENFDDSEELRSKVERAITHQVFRAWRKVQQDTRLRRQSFRMLMGTNEQRSLDLSQTTRSYEALSISLDYGDSSTLQLDQVIASARDAIEKRHYRKAIELISTAAARLGEHGYSDTVLELLDLARNEISPDVLERSDQAWMLCFEGLALYHRGFRSEAISSFQSMNDLGESLGDFNITSTALQNLAIVALSEGNFEEAKDLNRRSFDHMREIGDDRGALQIAINNISLLSEMGESGLAADLVSNLEPIFENLEDDHLRCTFFGNKGVIAVKSQDLVAAKSYFHISLTAAKRSGDWHAIFSSMRNLGNINLELGSVFPALLWYRRAIEVANHLSSPPDQQIAHAAFAGALHKIGRLDRAVEHFVLARSYATLHSDHVEWAKLSLSAGSVSLEQECLEQAEILLTDAHGGFQKVGDTRSESITLQKLAEVHFALDDSEKAIVDIENAINLIPAHDHDERAQALEWGALTSLHAGAVEYAESFFSRSALEIGRFGDREARAWSRAKAGATLAAKNLLDSAKPFFSKSLEEFSQLDNQSAQYEVRNDRAIALTNVQRFDEARGDYEECMTIAKSLGEWGREFQTLLNRGEMERRSANYTLAQQLLRGAVELARTNRDPQSEAEALGNLGIALVNTDQLVEAEQSFENALRIAQTTNSMGTQATAIGGLASIRYREQEFSVAARLYLEAAELGFESGNLDHALEDIAGEVKCLAAIGDVDSISGESQRLIDLAQEIHSVPLAVEAFCVAAQRFSKLQLWDESIDMFVAATIGALVEDSHHDSYELLGLPLSSMILSFADHPSRKIQELYDELIERIEDRYSVPEEAIEFLRSMLNHIHLNFSSPEQLLSEPTDPNTPLGDNVIDASG